MTSEPFDVAAWNLSRLAAPPDSTYERQENAISESAIVRAQAELLDPLIDRVTAILERNGSIAPIIRKANIGDYGPAK